MTSPFASTDLAAMRAAATEAMLDTCKLGAVTATTSGTYATESLSWGAALACGFRAASMREAANGSQANTGDAELRLPYGTAVTGFDRIQLTHRGGVALGASAYYRVVGAPVTGLTAIVLRLQSLGLGGTE